MSGFLKKWFLSKCPEYNELQLQNQDLHNRCSNLQQSNSTLTQQLEERNAALYRQNPDSALAEVNTELQQQILDLNRQITSLKQQNASAASTVLPGNDPALTEKLKNAASSVAQLTSERDRLKAELESLNSRLEQEIAQKNKAQQASAALQQENENLQSKIAPLQNEIAELRQTNTELQNNIGNLQQTNSKQQKDISALEQTNENLQQKITELQNDIGNLEQTNSKQQKDISALEQTNENLQQKITELQNDIGNLEQTNENLQQRITELQNEIAELEKACLDWKDYCDKLVQQHEAEKEEIRQEWQTVVNEQAQKHNAELQATKADHAKDMDAKNTEIKNLHADYCQKLREEHEKSEQIQIQCKKTIENIEAQCQNAIANAQNVCNNEIAKLKSEHQKIMDLKETQIKDMVSQHAEDLKQAEIRNQSRIDNLIARENLLLGAGIADYFRSQSIEDREMRKYHLFLSLIYSCDQENNFAGVQNAYLLLDDHLKARYRQEPAVLNEKRQLIRKLFNANIRTIEIEELPEIGKHKLDYNQSHYTVRGSGNIITSVESPCLIYKTNNNVRPGLIHCV